MLGADGWLRTGDLGYLDDEGFRLGEELAVAVYPKPGHSLDPEDLRRHVGVHLAAFKVPSRVIVCAEPLPRNASGKLLRRALREQVLARPAG